MRRVSIRDLSADVIRRSASEDEIVGVTSKGNLLGVLVPLTAEVMRRLAAAEADSDADDESDRPTLDLEAVLRAPALTAEDIQKVTRVSIRELTGSRLEKATSSGQPLVVTTDRAAIAVFLPLVSGWIDRLVDERVAAFMAGSAPQAEPSRHVGAVQFPVGADALRSSDRRFTSQRAIGIRLVGDARNDRERIVGVVTDALARIKGEKIIRQLRQHDEAYVFQEILTLISDLSSQMSDAEQLIGVGVEVGGHVWNGRVVHSTNMRWNEFPFADQLSAELGGVPVVLENDANALAIHERYFEGIAFDNFAVVLLTHLGLGCGLILDGRIYRGSHGMAAELGHVPIERTDSASATLDPCRCGNPECLEASATPQAIETRLRTAQYTGTYEDALADTTSEVRAVFTEAGTAFGKGISTVLNVLNPDAVVLYGPLDLLGPPRKFYLNDVHAVNEPDVLTGMSKAYTGAMMDAVRRHAFSNAADECQFQVRTRSDEQGAKAAAACAIRAVRERVVSTHPSHVPAYARP